MSFLEACRKLISLESTSSVGTNEVAQFLDEQFQAAGLDSEIQKEYLGDIENSNIIARPKGREIGPELMLHSHIDTEDPGAYAMWVKTAKNPFNATIQDGNIYGLGVGSGKLDILCKLEAIKSFESSTLEKLPIVLVGTYGHYSGMAGAIKLIRRKKVNPFAALVGEPTSLRFVTEGAGYAVMENEIPFSNEEIAYHQDHDLMESSSTQSKFFAGTGEWKSLEGNAIVKMLDYLDNLPDGIAVMDLDGGNGSGTSPQSAVIEIDIVDKFSDSIVPKIKRIRDVLKSFSTDFRTQKDDGFEPPYSILNLGKIEKRGDHVRLLGSCRILPSVPAGVYESWLEKLQGVCETEGGNFRVIDYKRPFKTDLESQIFRDSKESVVHSMIAEPTTMTRGTEASVFSRVGIDSIAFGAGKSDGNFGFPDEQISISELETSISFYTELIKRVGQ